MIEISPILVIHWDYNKPDRSSTEIATHELLLIPIKAIPQDTTTKKGIGYRFTYRIKTKEQGILSYIAESYFTIDKTDEIGRAEIIKMVKDFYTPFEVEFDERKKGMPLKYSTLPKWDDTRFDHTPSIIEAQKLLRPYTPGASPRFLQSTLLHLPASESYYRYFLTHIYYRWKGRQLSYLPR
jgi:hypothetical protein